MQEQRISPAVIIIPVGLGLAVAAVVGFVVLARAAAPGMCLQLNRDKFYYFIYTGPSQTFKAALGECYPVIWIIDVYDPETTDWWPPADPEHEILQSGVECRVQVQETCTLCGFELIQ